MILRFLTLLAWFAICFLFTGLANSAIRIHIYGSETGRFSWDMEMAFEWWLAFAIPSVLGAAATLGLLRNSWKSYPAWLQFLTITLAGCFGIVVLNVRWLLFVPEAVSWVFGSETVGYGIYIALVGGTCVLLTVTLGRLAVQGRNNTDS